MTGAHYSRRSLVIDRESWKRRRMGQASDAALAAKRITGLFLRRTKGLTEESGARGNFCYDFPLRQRRGERTMIPSSVPGQPTSRPPSRLSLSLSLFFSVSFLGQFAIAFDRLR